MKIFNYKGRSYAYIPDRPAGERVGLVVNGIMTTHGKIEQFAPFPHQLEEALELWFKVADGYAGLTVEEFLEKARGQ